MELSPSPIKKMANVTALTCGFRLFVTPLLWLPRSGGQGSAAKHPVRDTNKKLDPSQVRHTYPSRVELLPGLLAITSACMSP